MIALVGRRGVLGRGTLRRGRRGRDATSVLGRVRSLRRRRSLRRSLRRGDRTSVLRGMRSLRRGRSLGRRGRNAASVLGRVRSLRWGRSLRRTLRRRNATGVLRRLGPLRRRSLRRWRVRAIVTLHSRRRLRDGSLGRLLRRVVSRHGDGHGHEKSRCEGGELHFAGSASKLKMISNVESFVVESRVNYWMDAMMIVDADAE
ncbi:hypothetical protein F4804DRAFT_260766 [Jackrogersella minutella]|nr:hypothetical protein F4804DRAFT_260766 [Jackrogersella minutella]